MNIVRHILAFLFLAAFLSTVSAQQTNDAKTNDALVAKARAIHEHIITLDTHNDISFNFATEKDDPGKVENTRQVTLPKMKEGGLKVGFFIVYVGQGERTPAGYDTAYAMAIKKFDAIHRMAEQMYPDQIEIAYTADDVTRIVKSGKLVACIGIENGWPVGKDLKKLKEFHDRGGRYITLAHNRHNDICDSANPGEGEAEAEHGGVSEFGKQVIAEMNRLGIMVDISHVSKKSALDAIALSRAPVIASHSGARAVNDNARNLDDETLLALGKNGGVVQCVALGDFVKTRPVPPERQEAIAALRKEFGLPEGRGGFRRAMQNFTEEQIAKFRERMREIDAKYPMEPVTVADFVNHIDHAVKLIGVDHVGISSDFDGGGGIQGWNNAAETFNVTLELVRRGYSEQDIFDLWGGNLLRVWKEVEKSAAQLQKKM
ncbi:MAG: membrane dipeptidase [Ignavibacteriales bacterium]|nr:membrane dipeptidase [Ignavibacteriales bacterium]